MAENKDNNITSVMEALVKGAESVFTTKTVVGEATKIDDTIIIPLVDVSFGIGAGASCGAGKDFPQKRRHGRYERQDVPQRGASDKKRTDTSGQHQESGQRQQGNRHDSRSGRPFYNAQTGNDER